MKDLRPIAFLGAGNMARAIISGLIKAGYPASLITAVNRTEEKNQALSREFGINTSTNALTAAKAPDVLVLGVKPQVMSDLMETLSDITWQDKLLLSIAAGITVARFENMANTSLNLIRIMPNTPCLITQGMSGLYAPTHIAQKDRDYCSELMQSVGQVCWVEEEEKINGIIAAAGSAPAYFFLFMEGMQNEAKRLGFSEETARQLVQQSALGAAGMVIANPDTDIATLRAQVTSKGGTTAQAISVFEQNNLSETVSKAMQAAVNRAKEMENAL